jgi:hypothetical protein|tara:strand:- start:991 stop:1485 length:495 start_codon:yes stop_codon:yes gene_type:complete
MKKLPIFEDFVPVGFGASNAANYGLGGGYKNTGYSMDAIVGPVQTLGNHIAEQANSYESNDNEKHSSKEYIKEAKKHINDKIDEACETYSAMDEASDYEFKPNEAATRLKTREKENIQRYRAAQERGDNYAISLYELKIKMDKIDLEGLKVQTAIHQLKQKNGK